jgi:MFS family permease
MTDPRVAAGAAVPGDPSTVGPGPTPLPGLAPLGPGSTIAPAPDPAAEGVTEAVAPESAAAVLRNRPFLLLWLSQAATQIGGNMVVYGLTVLVYSMTNSNSAVSFLLLTFLVPGVLFSAVAGVYVDRLDRRHILIATNLLRAAAFGLMLVAGQNLIAIYVLNVFVSTVTTFFAPAEASMIPMLVPRGQLLAANGLFTLTMNAAFAVGFALLGPLVVSVAGPEALIGLVALLYLIAAFFCFTLPGTPVARGQVTAGEAVGDVERALGAVGAQLREAFAYIRDHPAIGWSLAYLAIGAALIGVLGVLGPDFAKTSLGLEPKDFIVVVLPLGIGIVLGALSLGRAEGFVARRRLIESGMIALGVLLITLSLAGPITRLLQRVSSTSTIDVSALVSMLSVVLVIAFLAGVSYAFVLIPSQTQLQEDLPEEVRGRVFGVLNTLVSVASFLPIIIVGTIADFVGTQFVIMAVGVAVLVAGVLSVARRRPGRRGSTSDASAKGEASSPGVASTP